MLDRAGICAGCSPDKDSSGFEKPKNVAKIGTEVLDVLHDFDAQNQIKLLVSDLDAMIYYEVRSIRQIGMAGAELIERNATNFTTRKFSLAEHLSPKFQVKTSAGPIIEYLVRPGNPTDPGDEM